MGEYFLSLDQSTSSSSAQIQWFSDEEVIVIAKASEAFPQHYPKAGYVEHDLLEIWNSQQVAIRKAIEQAELLRVDFKASKIAGIGITNQRETFGLWESKSLKPLGPAIVWQCKRSVQLCEELKIHESEVVEKTGLLLDPYFSGSKMRWAFEQRPDLAQALGQGRAQIGTIDTYLLARLTNGGSYKTEPSNASRTLLYNLHTGEWDSELLELFGVPNAKYLPEICDSVCEFGRTQGVGAVPDGIPIFAMLGDQQAALAGQHCFLEGEAKCTYGTGAFLLANSGSSPRKSKHKLLSTVAWQLNGSRTYALEGSCFIAGAAVEFLQDLNILSAVENIDVEVARKAAPELYVIPCLQGLGTPYWQPGVRGGIFGMHRGTTRGELIKATLEGVALQVGELIEAMSLDLGSSFSCLRVDGGVSRNRAFLQDQTDFSGLSIQKPQNFESTVMGSGMFAAYGYGVYSDLVSMKAGLKIDEKFEPKADVDKIQSIRKHYKKAIQALQFFHCEG